MAPDRDVADVLIIGAGASGAAAAWSLASGGLAVVCLEQGDWIDPTDYPHHRPDWELHRQTDFAKDPNVRQRPEDYPLNNDDSPIVPLMFNAVGGSTVHWSGHFPRFRPSDFRVKTLDDVADNWPLTYWDLEPYYEENDANIGVSGLEGDPSGPPRLPRQTPPLGLDAAAKTYIRGLKKLGWHWWPTENALITAPFGEVRQVCNYCGPCDMGCPRGAMSSAHVTYWPAALAKGARLITRARVREITVDRRGRASGAVYYTPDGGIAQQRARVVIVACNGVGTPRLLLNSVSSLFPHGLANSNGLVGTHLMFHPIAFVSGVFPDRVDGHAGPVGLLLHCHEFYETDLSRGFVRGIKIQLCRESGPLSTALGHFPGEAVPWGAAHHRVQRERSAHMLAIAIMVEDLPEPHNRVSLDPKLADGNDIPAPKVSYTVSENSRKALDFGIARARELLEAAGATEIMHQALARNSGWHLMGTARMGDDPGNSVVDRYGRAHDVPNLFIIDGSIFVTSAAVNPTSTIQALALYVSDWLKHNLREVA